MTRRSLKRWLAAVAAKAAILVQAAVPALADPPPATPASHRSAPQILYPRAANAGGSWLGSGFHIQKKAGFAYTHRFDTSDTPLVFRIQGPVLRQQKALGLTFKLLPLLGRPSSWEAIGPLQPRAPASLDAASRLGRREPRIPTGGPGPGAAELV